MKQLIIGMPWVNLTTLKWGKRNFGIRFISFVRDWVKLEKMK